MANGPHASNGWRAIEALTALGAFIGAVIGAVIVGTGLYFKVSERLDNLESNLETIEARIAGVEQHLGIEHFPTPRHKSKSKSSSEAKPGP